MSTPLSATYFLNESLGLLDDFVAVLTDSVLNSQYHLNVGVIEEVKHELCVWLIPRHNPQRQFNHVVGDVLKHHFARVIDVEVVV